MIRVLVVDDSAYMRYVLQTNLSLDADIKVIGTARDGLDALEKIAILKPDVVTLDLEMPRMDGFTALKRIMAEFPLPVIMLSSLTQEGADATISALRMGAIDFVAKPVHGVFDFRTTREELLRKIKNAYASKPPRYRILPLLPVNKQNKIELETGHRNSEKIVVIGTSTGGPRALHEVLPYLPASLSASVLIVQHMPPGFTKSLASRLDEVCALKVSEAKQGDLVQPGCALIAPGDYHMTISQTGRVDLNQKAPIHGVRPSVDATMESAARMYGPAAVGVILTGMGCDGTYGAKLMKKAGGRIIAEDESTCVVYGMPRSAVEAGVVDKIVPLERVASEIVAQVEGKPSVHASSAFGAAASTRVSAGRSP